MVENRLLEKIASMEARLGACPGADPQSTDSAPIENDELVEELHISLEELRVANAELERQNETLINARYEVDCERWKYQDLFDNAPLGYVVTDTFGTIQEANRKTCTMLGIEPIFLFDKPLTNYVSMPDRGAFRSLISQTAQYGGTRRIYARFKTRHRQEFEVAVTVTAVSDPSGLPITLRWSLADLSEEIFRPRNGERHMRDAIAETHHRVKNSLQIIAGLLEFQLADNGESVPTETVRQFGAQIHAIAAVHDLLTQEAASGGSLHGVSAQELLEKLIIMIQETAPRSALTYRLDDARLTTRQATSFALILNELASNAMKHGRPPIHIDFAADDKQLVLRVSDNGDGFEEDFDPKKDGHIGLEMLESLCRQDLGCVLYSNQDGAGAVVSVTMPVQAQEQHEVSPPPPRAMKRELAMSSML